jgi:hypothetical protein
MDKNCAIQTLGSCFGGYHNGNEFDGKMAGSTTIGYYLLADIAFINNAGS